MTIPLKFTAADADRAYEEWGANCGPGAIAAVLGMSLDEVRPHLGDFERKHYTNPTLMFDTLKRLNVDHSVRRGVDYPDFGLARIQWHGPWMAPGVPVRARYRHTHWIAVAAEGVWHADERRPYWVFDINSTGSGWVPIEWWRGTLVPWLLDACVPRANGTFSTTHAIEIRGEYRRRAVMGMEAAG